MIFNVLRTYKLQQKFIIILFVIDIFAWLIAPFSKYHPSNIEVYLDILCFLSAAISKSSITSEKNIIIALKYLVACLAILMIPVFFYGNIPFVSDVTKLLYAFSFVSLRSDIKWAIYQLFIPFFTLFLILGIIEWILLIFGINFLWATVYRWETLEFQQGIFILVPTYVADHFRFMSLCEEPSVIGNTCFFLITTLDYQKYKIPFIIFMVAGLISFSLGFYVLIVLWALTQNKRFKASQIFMGIIAIAFMMIFFGESFNARIMERITGQESIEAIDNRVNYEVQHKLDEVSQDYRIFIGMGNRNFYEWQQKSEGVSAGVKNFLLQYGILGLLLLVYAYSALIFRTRGYSKHTLLIVVFVWICFYKSHVIWNNPSIILALLTTPIEIIKDRMNTTMNLTSQTIATTMS